MIKTDYEFTLTTQLITYELNYIVVDGKYTDTRNNNLYLI